MTQLTNVYHRLAPCPGIRFYLRHRVVAGLCEAGRGHRPRLQSPAFRRFERSLYLRTREFPSIEAAERVMLARRVIPCKMRKRRVAVPRWRTRNGRQENRMMTDLKITGVEAIYLRLPEVKTQCDSGQDALIVKVTTDAGIVGYGEVDSNPMAVKGCIEGPFSHTTATGPGARADRRGPVPDRVPLAQDVPGQHLRRPARDRHPRHERHRPGPLGHQGQGARAAGLEAARRRVHEVAAGLRQLALRRDARRDRRAGPAVRRPGVHGRQVRLGPDGPGSPRPTSPWSARPAPGSGPTST